MRLKKSSLPLYYQLEKALRKRILSGQLKTDEPLPTEKELCDEFGVSRTTVRQALSKLEEGDLIRREQGRGTFVSIRLQNDTQYRLYGYMEDLFTFGSTTGLKLVSKKLLQPDPNVAQEMLLDAGDKVFLFEGYRIFGKNRRAFFQAFVPQIIGEKIDLAQVDKPLLISFVERAAMETARTAMQATSAEIASKKMAKAMNLASGSPLLVVKRIYYTAEERVLELAVTYFPGTVFTSVARLDKVSVFSPDDNGN